MSLESLREATSSLLQTALAASVYASMPLKFDNVNFNTGPNMDYISFTIIPYDDKRASIGTSNKYQKHYAYLVVEVYIRENTGTRRQYEIMEWAAKVFEEKSLPLNDGDTLVTYTAKKTVQKLQFGYVRSTVMIPTLRRSNRP